MEMVRENGLKVCMATSTAVHPAWILCDLLHPEGEVLLKGYDVKIFSFQTFQA